MTLRDTVGVRFSQLADNHVPSQYSPREYVAWHPFECYGWLPDGTHFGVGKIRSIMEYWEDDLILVDADGFLFDCGINIDGGAIGRNFPMPDAIVASPSGESIVWLAKGQLWVWRHDPWDKRFSGFSVGLHRVYMPDGASVADACMNEDATLDVWCDSGEHCTFLPDADVLLAPGTWGPLLCVYEFPFERRCKWESYIEACVKAAPEIAGMLMYGSADLLILASEGSSLPDLLRQSSRFRELRLSSDYNYVGSWLFYDAGLERVVLSAGVEEVDGGAFAYNSELSDFVVEGDTSRLANWAADAFLGCPCEKAYLELRSKAV